MTEQQLFKKRKPELIARVTKGMGSGKSQVPFKQFKKIYDKRKVIIFDILNTDEDGNPKPAQLK